MREIESVCERDRESVCLFMSVRQTGSADKRGSACGVYFRVFLSLLSPTRPDTHTSYVKVGFIF